MKFLAICPATIAAAALIALAPLQALADCDHMENKYERVVLWANDASSDLGGRDVDFENSLPDCSGTRGLKELVQCLNITGLDTKYIDLVPRDHCDEVNGPEFWDRNGPYDGWLDQVRRQAAVHFKKVEKEAKERRN